MGNLAVATQVPKGYRMSCPMGCPTLVHEVMLECWQLDRRERITFATLLPKLQDLLKQAASTPGGLPVDPKNVVPAGTKRTVAAAAAAAAASSSVDGGTDYSMANYELAANTGGGGGEVGGGGGGGGNYSTPQDAVMDRQSIGGEDYLGVGAVDGTSADDSGAGMARHAQLIRKASQQEPPYVPLGNAFQQSARKASQTLYTPAGEAADAAAAAAAAAGAGAGAGSTAKPRVSSVYLGFVDGVQAAPEGTLKLPAGVLEAGMSGTFVDHEQIASGSNYLRERDSYIAPDEGC
eukprot:gene6997-5758_t